MSDDKYLHVFMEEGREHVQKMNTLLLQLENDGENTALIDELFRSAHTLKGMSATMGFAKMADLTHAMENKMQQLRDGETVLTDEMMDLFFRGVDNLEHMIEQAASGEEMAADEGLLAQLQSEEEASSAHVPAEDVTLDEYERNVLLTAIDKGHSAYRVDVTLDEQSVLKGARAYMVYRTLEKAGEVVKSVPDIEDLEDEAFDRSFQFVTVTTVDENDLEQALGQISELEKVEIQKLSAEMVRGALRTPGKTATKETRASGAAASPLTSLKASKTIRVDIDRLDTLMNLFSEWVIDRGRLERLSGELGNEELEDIVDSLNRMGGDLQDTILTMRMVAVDQVFNRFPRMMRDLAKELKKEIQFEITGADTELDRTVIDEIGDPLVHLLRNALDHGMELPEERKRRGKPEVGRITLRAFHSGNFVFIEIEDDGAGIDRDKVLKKAMTKGLVDEETAAQLNDSQVFDLLFDPGFSTAEEVSDVSGRGVGLDVVRSTIEALGGSVTVRSVAGEGSTFSIQLPMTLSILTALLVKVARETYAIPLNSILETGKFHKSEIKKVHGQPVLRFRGNIVPIRSMKRAFAVPGATEQEKDELLIVIIKKGELLTGLIVDEFIGQQEIVLKSLGNYLDRVFAISGATILGDGQVAMIVDANALVLQPEAV